MKSLLSWILDSGIAIDKALAVGVVFRPEHNLVTSAAFVTSDDKHSLPSNIPA